MRTSPLNSNFNFTLLRVKLHAFNGEDPSSWIKRCVKCFSMNKIPKNQWVEVAAMFLEGKAKRWLEGFLARNTNGEWETFCTDLCKRFEGKENVMEEFNKLQQ